MTGLTPDITEVAVIRHGVLRLQFADGAAGEVDVLARMRGPVFERARTESGFAEATLDAESGTVVWPGGADLAPDTLYERIYTGLWPEQNLAA
jgi:predicted dinucleotide-utilizing enzyme